MSDFAVPQPAFGETICTLFDGDFHFGVAAMVNSLARGGYKGTVWAGYRGALPPWLGQLKRIDGAGDQFLVGENIRLAFIKVDTEIHMSLYKPQYLQRLLANEARGSEYIWFFDSDIFFRGKWSFFQKWQRFGIAVCQDVNYRTLPEFDPLRQEWMEIASAMGLGKPRPLNYYFNGGMAGAPASAVSFLKLWEAMIAKAGELGMDLKSLTSGTRDMPFHIPDQDALNVSVMYTEHPVAPTGPEVMGFLPGRSNMYHSVGPKPWRGSLFMRALKGEPPSNSAKFFFTQVSGPIFPYTESQLKGKKLACNIAAFIGRFYSRR